MPVAMLARFALLPELNLTWVEHKFPSIMILHADKVSPFEVCPKCASKSFSIYDYRVVQVKDEPIRRQHVILRINKRRFYCRPCRKPFTEPAPGIGKGLSL